MDVASSADLSLTDAVLMVLVGCGYGLALFLLAVVFRDLVDREDLVLRRAVLWGAVALLVPLGGALAYLVTQRAGWARRRPQRVATRRARRDAHLRAVAGGDGFSGVVDGRL